jgi:hypothetical protein
MALSYPDKITLPTLRCTGSGLFLKNGKPQNKHHYPNRDEYKKQYFGNTGCASFNIGETENSCHNSYDEEYK